MAMEAMTMTGMAMLARSRNRKAMRRVVTGNNNRNQILGTRWQIPVRRRGMH
ncbi:hypothetical protein DPMN_147198 [Dreissena polymorpha]|uniref:Uncharacterized protein n=1 Tax=Dreissena polymorpha TaxID=45954 RepID=A0A9D4FBR7_DREPO|nr:hypothetical protein DPMN_147198 [Dreissena polymorpha]